MGLLGRLWFDIIANTSEFKTGLDGARRDLAGFKTSAQGMGTELTRLRGPLTSIVVGLTGVSGATGRFAATLAALVAGGGPAMLATAAIGGLALGYRHFTKEAREAAEANKKFSEEMKKAAQLRADPNFELKTSLKEKKAELATLRARESRLIAVKGRAIGYGASLADGSLADVRKEIEGVQVTIDQAKAKLAASGDDMVRSLQFEFKTFGLSTEAVKRHAIAIDTSLDPAQRKAATSLLTQLEGLRLEKEARDEVKKRLKEQADEQERLTKAILANQRAWRIEAGGGGNRTAGMGGTENLGALRGGLMLGASSEEISHSRGLASMAGLQQSLAAAALWRETWINAIRGSQEAFADFFESIGEEGFKLVNLFEGIAKAVHRTLAQLASQQVVNAIFGGAFSIAGPGATNGSVGNQTQSGSGANLRAAPVVVHQVNHFAPQFLDGADGEAWLRRRAGVIASVVAEAASDAPGFAQHIVANGMRR